LAVSHKFHGSRARALAIRYLQEGNYDEAPRIFIAYLSPRTHFHREHFHSVFDYWLAGYYCFSME
jgi:hypothetical protein